MELRVTVKRSSSPRKHFSQEQLKEIAKSLCVVLPDKMRLVYHGQNPPGDTTLTWQPTNAAGDPVGASKQFIDGVWQ